MVTRKLSRGPRLPADGKGFSLKALAERLGLTPATVSLVLNDAPVASTIA
jgi:transcriptional regulator with XRE-family HTH domain